MTRPETAAQAVEWANVERVCWYQTGSGKIELAISLEDARSGSHQGKWDPDIAELRKVPYIAEQLAALTPATVADELDEYGCWDETELADHDQNLNRLLWLACGDIKEAKP